MHTNRITVEEVKAAIERTGMKPIRERYIGNNDNCGCAMGIIARAAGVDANVCEIDDYVTTIYGVPYVSGFAKGFDGDELIASQRLLPESVQGHSDGKAVAAALFQEQGA